MIRSFPIPLEKVRDWYSFCKIILPVVFPPPKSPSPSREYPPLKRKKHLPTIYFQGISLEVERQFIHCFFSVKTIVFSKGSLQSTFPGYYNFNGLWLPGICIYIYIGFFFSEGDPKISTSKARCMEASPTKASKHRSNSSKLVFSPWLVSKFLQEDWSGGVVGSLKIWWHTRGGWWQNVNMFPHKKKMWTENVWWKWSLPPTKKNMVTWEYRWPEVDWFVSGGCFSSQRLLQGCTHPIHHQS